MRLEQAKACSSTLMHASECLRRTSVDTYENTFIDMCLLHSEIDDDGNGTLEKDEIVKAIRMLGAPPQKASPHSQTCALPHA